MVEFALILVSVLGAQDTILPDGVLYTGLTGCNATAINVATECEIKSTVFGGGTRYVHQYHSLSAFIYYARSGGTGYTFKVAACIEGMTSSDCTDASDWYNVSMQSVTGANIDVDTKTYRRAVSADDYATFFITSLYPRLKFHTITCSGGGCTANDKITIKVVAHTDPVEVYP